MLLRVFTIASVTSLLLCLACAGVAVWANAGRSAAYVARDGRLWDLWRSDGNVVVWTMPWPRDEPVVTLAPPRIIYEGGPVRRHDFGVVTITEANTRMVPSMLDPWGRIPPVTRAPVWAIGLRTWRCVGLFVVLPFAWVLWRFRFGRVDGPGFGVEPVRK